MNEEMLSRFDCFTDGRPDDFVALRRLYPRGRFILNVRDLNGWLASRIDHVRRAKSSGRWRRPNEQWDDTDRSLEKLAALRNSYHYRVLDYFQSSPDELLIVNLCRDSGAAEKIHGFLGLGDAPRRSPHENSSPRADTLGRNRERIRGLLEQLGIPADEHSNDILCPALLCTEQQGRYPDDTSALLEGGWSASPRADRLMPEAEVHGI